MSQKLFLIFCVYACLNCAAQAPGYMGKKLSFGYGFNFNPAISTYGRGSADSPLNTQHEFFLEHVLGRRTVLGASLRLYNSSYKNTRTIDYGAFTSGFEEQHPSGSYAIKARSIALYSKIFKQIYVAPWGTYYTTGIVLNVFTVTYDPARMYITGRTYSSGNGYTEFTSSDFGPTEQKYMYPDLVAGWGRSRIFKDLIIFDYGYNVNFLATSFTLMDMLDSGFGTTTYVDNYIRKTAHARMRGINRFNIYIKIGLLF